MKSRIQLLLAVAAVSFVMTTSLFWVFEVGANATVQNYFDVVWWWVVTSATVGYGDIVPVTWQGRAVSIVTIVTGFFIYTNFVAIIAESVHEYLERRSLGIAYVKTSGHVVICEYTAIADEFILSIPECPELADRDIVIVSDLVSRSPYREHYFVRGVPLNPATLRQASVKDADYIFIFANHRFADPDVKTMHIASRVIKMNPSARVFVEMIDPENDLLQYTSDQVVPMASSKLIEAVLRYKKVRIDDWIQS